MTTATRTIRAHYDGRAFVPDEPVELAPDTPVDVLVTAEGQTWASLRLGVRPVRLRGRGPSASDTVIQERERGH